MTSPALVQAVKTVAAALRPAVTRWRAFWDVDHRAANFYSEEEWLARKEQREEIRKAAQKAEAMGHFKEEVLPRMSLDVSKGFGGLKLQQRKDAIEGDIWHLYQKCVAVIGNTLVRL